MINRQLLEFEFAINSKEEELSRKADKMDIWNTQLVSQNKQLILQKQSIESLKMQIIMEDDQLATLRH